MGEHNNDTSASTADVPSHEDHGTAVSESPNHANTTNDVSNFSYPTPDIAADFPDIFAGFECPANAGDDVCNADVDAFFRAFCGIPDAMESTFPSEFTLFTPNSFGEEQTTTPFLFDGTTTPWLCDTESI